MTWPVFLKGVRVSHLLPQSQGIPGGSVVKNQPPNAGDMGSVSGLGRSSGGGNSNPLQYSCLGNFLDRGYWRATVCGIINESNTT